jgi:signal transduction histidine kinase
VPHRESKNGAAHFEHQPWNFECSLRDRTWDAQRLEGLLAKLVMKKLREKLAAKGIAFSTFISTFIDRVQSLGIKTNELLERFITDADGLISQIESDKLI